MKNTFTLMLLTFALAAVISTENLRAPSIVVAEDVDHSFDGQSYVVEIGKLGEPTGTIENLEFENGKFHSTLMEDKEYASSEYLSDNENGSIRFNSVTKNKAGDMMYWNGEIKDKNTEGTVTLRPKGAKGSTLWFKSTPPRE